MHMENICTHMMQCILSYLIWYICNTFNYVICVSHTWFTYIILYSIWLHILYQFSSVAQSSPTLWDLMDCSMPGFPVHHQLPCLLSLMSNGSGVPSNHLILWSPLLPPAIFPSIRVFSNESVLCIRWPKYRSFSFSISPSNEYSGLISFRIYRFDLLAVQGTLKNVFQHHSSKASFLQHLAFFIVQLSHPYMTTGNTTALIRQTFIGKVMSLLFNMLSSWS